ncbi:MAG TPA: LolA-related protein [Steroidobacteraceae bacterium]|nr:LolA-related protein [Steroidobacteraceae bacterium]
MISGKPKLPLLALTLLPALCATAATLDAGALIGRLAKPAPATVAFREVRFSSLVNEPLIVAGELGYSGPASLDRTVTQPYRETVAIRGESVTVEREGEPTRTFGLNRAPELRGLLNGFTALLAGDPAAIERSFDVAASGSDDAWTLELTPTDARARRRLQQIVVNGHADVPQCFTMLTAKGSASVLLLGAAADRELPKPTTLDALKHLCSAE